MEPKANRMPALVLASALIVTPASAQTPPAAPVPTPGGAMASTSSPAAVAPLRLSDPSVLSISRLPAENPFGVVAETPSLLPPKPVFPEVVLAAPFYASLRVDRTGKVTQVRRVRDPIPSLSADSKKSFDRWAFDPARKGGQPVESWAALRIDLQVELRAPRIEQVTLTAVTPTTPIPPPFEWGADTAWYENLRISPPSDGTVPLEQVDTPPNPKKTKWDADSYKGPFSCRFWVRVTAAGRIDKSIPLQVSDPILIAYFRRAMPAWQLRPARVKGQPADSWNELAMAGQIGYDVEIQQIANLRKTLVGS